MIKQPENIYAQQMGKTAGAVLRRPHIILTVLLFLICLLNAGQALAAPRIKLAAIYALSGKAAEGNYHALTGIRMAVKEINEFGGILGRKIDLKVFDNKSTPEGSTMAAKKAAGAGVVAIIGPAWSSHAFAVAKIAQGAGIPMVSSSATNPGVTRMGNYIFRACYVDHFQGYVLADFLRKDLRGDSVVILVDPRDQYSVGLAKEFRKHFEEAGGLIMASLHYNQNQTGFKKLISKVKPYDPQYLFIPGHDESARIAVASKAAGLRAVPVGGDGWDSKLFFRVGGSKIKKGYYTTHWSPSVQALVSYGFLDKYHKNRAFGAHMALGYDTVFLVADAIKRAGTINRRQVRDALAATRSFEGVTGMMSFDKHGDPVKGAVIMKIKNGKPYFEKSVMP